MTASKFAAFKKPVLTAEEYSKEFSSEESARRFEEGIYDVEITGCTVHKKCADPTWDMLKITYTGPGGRKMDNYLVWYPTESPYFGEDQETRQFVKFCTWVKVVLGIDVTLDNLEDVLTKHFTDPSKLCGRKLKIRTAFNKYRQTYVSKGVFHCTAPNGDVSMDEAGNPLTFTKWEEVQDYVVKVLKKQFDGRAEIAEYIPATEGASAPAAKAGPKKASKADVPF